MNEARNILVTGGAGYVGSALVPRLLEAGHSVTVLDLYLYGHDVFPGASGHPDLIEIKGDLRNAATVDKAITNCELRLADMYKLPVASASVDAVTIHQVLHFADEPAAVIAETARVLRPGGRLIVIDFAPHELEELRADHAHRRLGFGDEEVRGWFQKAGLNPASTTVLEGDPLTVVIWPAERASAPERPRETVRAHTGVAPQ